MLGVIQDKPLADQGGLLKGEDDQLYSFKFDDCLHSNLDSGRYVLFEVESFFPAEDGYAKAYRVEPHFGFEGVTPEAHTKNLNEQKSWNVFNWIHYSLKNTFNFGSRARRKEILIFSIFCLVLSMGVEVIDRELFAGIKYIGLALNLILLIPNISMSFRRLADLDLSKWYALLLLVPFANILFGLYILLAEGSRWTNKSGYPTK